MKNPTGFWALVARILGNSYKDTFLAHLGSTLIMGQFGIVGPLAAALSPFFRGILGFLVETGIFNLELSVDALKEGMKRKDFERDSLEAWRKATAKVYTEKEKDAIRKEYLKIISAFGNVGDGPNP